MLLQCMNKHTSLASIFSLQALSLRKEFLKKCSAGKS